MSQRFIKRTDTSLVARWWWTVDRPLLVVLLLLLVCGAITSLTATPPVAERLGLPPFALAFRQLVLLPVALLCILSLSFFSVDFIRRAAILATPICLVVLLYTLFWGDEIKGASRWISLFGFSVQPSEFAKLLFALVSAWFLAESAGSLRHPASQAGIALYICFALLIVLQPDIGQFVILTAIFGAQFWMAGFSLWLVASLLVLLLGAAITTYLLFPHVAERVHAFLDPTKSDSYQIDQSLTAFMQGGWFGNGIAEGNIKEHLPDAHADFVFAVVAEEFGLIGISAVLCLFAFFSLRVFVLMALQTCNSENRYATLAAAGLITQFVMQVLINIGSSLRMIPTKGMTLPFLSYGGSSLLAVAISTGILLALLRHLTAQTAPTSDTNIASAFAIRLPSAEGMRKLENRGTVS